MFFDAYLQGQREAARRLQPEDRPFAQLQDHAAAGVLLLHGSAASPCNHRTLARELFEQGYHVYAPLLAGHENLKGLYQGETSWLRCLAQALHDAEAFASVCSELHVLGSSFGGTLAYLMGIENPERFHTVMALSAPVIANDGWSPRDPWGREVKGAIVALDQHLPDFRLPLLVGHAVDDSLVYVNNAHTAFSRVGSERKKMVIYQGVGHGLGFVQNTPELASDLHQFMAFTQSPQTFTLEIPDNDYNTVSLAGSFNNWNANSLPFYRHGQSWRCDVALSPGDYTYKLVINGQDWILDPTSEIAHAPHGEKNSRLSIRP
jgi:esterase/lipase